MNGFIRKIVSTDEVFEKLSGVIVMSKLMGYKVSFGKNQKGHVIIFNRDESKFFKLKIVHKGIDRKKHRIQLMITVKALNDYDIFNKYNSVKHNYSVSIEDISCVTRQGYSTIESCSEIIDELSFLL